METILVVDDEQKIRDSYRTILTRQGYDVLEAKDALEADEILLHNAIDLMLLDINMPLVDGGELYDVAKMFHAHVKTIISSVYPIEDQKEKICGATDYFDKSEGLRVLLKKIKRHLGREEKKIVIIDDEQRTRILFNRHLTKAGFEVTQFGDNKVALSFLREKDQHIDVIILDIAMPHIDGCEFYEIVTAQWPDTKVLISSNYPIEKQRLIIFNAHDYYDKSDGLSVLVEKVRNLTETDKKEKKKRS